MIDVDARRPKIESPRLEIIHASGDALTMGVSIRVIEGVSVRITDPAKTVADCFRYRRHVGLEVAITALRDYLAKSRKGRPGQRPRRELLMEAAKVDRVQRIILPYLQALS